jgi:hypothetical protein
VKSDRKCICRFIYFLSVIGASVSARISWPEDETEGDIDAIAMPYAIEHMSFDAFRDGREQVVPLNVAIGDLGAKFRDRLGFNLSIKFGVYDLKKGQKQDWRGINNSFSEWISKDARQLPVGIHTLEIPGVPFAFSAQKNFDLSDGVFFGRLKPNCADLGKRLNNGLTIRHNKIKKLAPYKAQGLRTLLLLESPLDDMTLIDAKIVADAWRAAFPVFPEDLNELWVVQNQSNSEFNIFDMVGGKGWIFDADNNRILAKNENIISVIPDAHN